MCLTQRRACAVSFSIVNTQSFSRQTCCRRGWVGGWVPFYSKAWSSLTNQGRAMYGQCHKGDVIYYSLSEVTNIFLGIFSVYDQRYIFPDGDSAVLSTRVNWHF